jgi:hypothetical protein
MMIPRATIRSARGRHYGRLGGRGRNPLVANLFMNRFRELGFIDYHAGDELFEKMALTITAVCIPRHREVNKPRA